MYDSYHDLGNRLKSYEIEALDRYEVVKPNLIIFCKHISVKTRFIRDMKLIMISGIIQVKGRGIL